MPSTNIFPPPHAEQHWLQAGDLRIPYFRPAPAWVQEQASRQAAVEDLCPGDQLPISEQPHLLAGPAKVGLELTPGAGLQDVGGRMACDKVVPGPCVDR